MYLSKIEKYMRKTKTFLVSIIGLSRFHVVDRILGKKWKMAWKHIDVEIIKYRKNKEAIHHSCSNLMQVIMKSGEAKNSDFIPFARVVAVVPCILNQEQVGELKA